MRVRGFWGEVSWMWGCPVLIDMMCFALLLTSVFAGCCSVVYANFAELDSS